MLKHIKPWLVLGAGAWGTALAIHLARASQPVFLWSYDPRHVGKMSVDRENQRYLPGIIFPENLTPCASLASCLDKVEQVLIAVPSVAFKPTLEALKEAEWQPGGLLSATKGFSADGGWLHDLVSDYWPSLPYAVLSGPSFAKEVALGRPTAVTIASLDAAWAQTCQHLFNQPTFRVYTSQDIIGVQLGGVAKNVLAIAVGVADGLAYGANARAALITRGLSELMRLGGALGADTQTLIGLSGLGDLVLTATDDQSRNRRFGLLLGRGQSVKEACQSIGHSVEGIQNAAQLYLLAEQLGVDAPIIREVVALLSGQKTPVEATQALLWRPSRAE